MKKATKIYLYSLPIMVLMLTMGCTKTLQENPVSIISPANFYKSDADFKAAVNGVFNNLIGTYANFGGIGPLIMSAGAEDVTSRPTAPELTQYDTFKATLNGSYLVGVWQQLYKTINAANGITSNLAAATAVSDANKKIYEGEACYLRALSYYHLTRWFGEVPIITADNQASATTVGQAKVADIYALIIKDLTTAEADLPLTQPSDKSAPTKGAVKITLADVYLTMTGWPLKDATKYALARDKAKEVMDLNMYSLEPDFSTLWKTANKLTNKEFIFSLNGLVPNNATHLHQSSRPGEEGGWSDFMTEPRFYNAFPAGPRKDASFWTVFANATHTTWQNSSFALPYIAKWRDGGTGATFAQAAVSSNNGDGFWVFYRYADALLIYAEAANMAEGSPSIAALNAVNLVRRRAGGNNQAVYADLPEGMGQAAFDAAVITEREWEFAFENKRWFDLVRKEQVVSANIALYPYVDAHNQLLPKPSTEVGLIKGLTQNPGY